MFFFSKLIAVLREMKYLTIRGTENLPESAQAIFERNDELLKYIANLDLIVLWYNKVRETVLEVEFPIIESQVKSLDSILMKAEQSLDWNSKGTA